MGKGKLIVIEAPDSSGKATQAKRLYEFLKKQHAKVRKVEFPNYDSDSSFLIKKYLNGEFGENPESVDPYVASTFYTIDRYMSFNNDWGEFYNNNGIVVADRYTTSNMVHQAAKFHSEQEKEKYLKWLWEYEFEIFKLPVPDVVFFLDVPPEFREKLLQERNIQNPDSGKDIHEKNSQHLFHAYNNALEVALKYGWQIINCTENGQLKPVEVIHKKICEKVEGFLIE